MSIPKSVFDADFLSPSQTSQDAYRDALTAAEQVLARHFSSLGRCYDGPDAPVLAENFADVEVCPEEGMGVAAALDRVGELVLRHSVMVSDPTCIGHLHCPPVIPALAAEALISATNQSMDSWDQAPAATYLEQRVVDWLCGLYGLGGTADGIFTSGGTQSNFMALLLARDIFCRRELNWRVQEQGLPPEASRLRILCSAAAHFSVQQSAAILGLGQNAVVPVALDATRRMDVEALRRTIAEMRAEGLLPFAIAATAGTTDYGSIDPLPELAELAAAHGLWLHVDAAYGGALALSDRHAGLLDGIGLADSVTVDFHKLFYQPISCSALLVRDRAGFDAIRLHADYLNPEDHAENGVLDLVTKSIQTTRRFDGLKPFVTLQALGRRRLAAMIDATIDLARQTAALIAGDGELELAAPPVINALVLRFAPAGVGEAALDEVNARIQDRLLKEGKALLARTKVDGKVFLKMTLLNPRTSWVHVETILDQLKAIGHDCLKVAA